MASLWEHLDEEDRHGLILCSGLTICIAGAWIYLGAEPHDLSAYRYGAELFWSGENPYIKANMVVLRGCVVNDAKTNILFLL